MIPKKNINFLFKRLISGLHDEGVNKKCYEKVFLISFLSVKYLDDNLVTKFFFSNILQYALMYKVTDVID